ncbi:unnamed protein product [Prorocentrum cordatum]|uniref:Uncharacterized protein n=1 Tax=Prorocentrum cordatum TaxID=2364126 RepID=A0ABN9TM60_9DINO|nr:unnamed protein product [Polarella glacialis]
MAAGLRLALLAALLAFLPAPLPRRRAAGRGGWGRPGGVRSALPYMYLHAAQEFVVRAGRALAKVAPAVGPGALDVLARAERAPNVEERRVLHISSREIVQEALQAKCASLFLRESSVVTQVENLTADVPFGVMLASDADGIHAHKCPNPYSCSLPRHQAMRPATASSSTAPKAGGCPLLLSAPPGGARGATGGAMCASGFYPAVTWLHEVPSSTCGIPKAVSWTGLVGRLRQRVTAEGGEGFCTTGNEEHAAQLERRRACRKSSLSRPSAVDHRVGGLRRRPLVGPHAGKRGLGRPCFLHSSGQQRRAPSLELRVLGIQQQQQQQQQHAHGRADGRAPEGVSPRPPRHCCNFPYRHLVLNAAEAGSLFTLSVGMVLSGLLAGGGWSLTPGFRSSLMVGIAALLILYFLGLVGLWVKVKFFWADDGSEEAFAEDPCDDDHRESNAS